MTESDDPLSEYLAAALLGQMDHACNKLRKPGFGTGHEIFEIIGHSPETLGQIYDPDHHDEQHFLTLGIDAIGRILVAYHT